MNAACRVLANSCGSCGKPLWHIGHEWRIVDSICLIAEVERYFNSLYGTSMIRLMVLRV